MRTLVFDENLLRQTTQGMASLEFMETLTGEHYQHMASEGLLEVVSVNPGGVVSKQGDPAESFFIILSGSATIRRGPTAKSSWTIGRLDQFETFGEVALIDGCVLETTVIAESELLLLQFSPSAFQQMYTKISEFKSALEEIAETRRKERQAALDLPCREAASKVPLHVIQRHKVMPIRQEGQILVAGFVGKSSPGLMMRLKAHIPPGVNVAPVQIERDYFQASLQYLLRLQAEENNEDTSHLEAPVQADREVGAVVSKPNSSGEKAVGFDDVGSADDQTSRRHLDPISAADDETALGVGSEAAGLVVDSVANSTEQGSSEAHLWSEVGGSIPESLTDEGVGTIPVPSIDEFVVEDSVSDVDAGDESPDALPALAAAATLLSASSSQGLVITEEFCSPASRLRPREAKERLSAELGSLLAQLNGSFHRRLTFLSSAKAFVDDPVCGGAPEFQGSFLETELLSFVDPLLTFEGVSRFKRMGHIRFCAEGVDGRYRVTMSREHRGLRVSFQRIPVLPAFEDVCDLGPDEESQFAPKSAGGLVLVGGDNGARSLLLTALSSRALDGSSRSAISLEDPIEVLADLALPWISQRELGSDFSTVQDGLTGALREAPDVLWITAEFSKSSLHDLLRHTRAGLLAYVCFPGIRSIDLLRRLVAELASDPGVRDALSQDLRGVICPRICHADDGKAVLASDHLVPNNALRGLVSSGTLSDRTVVSTRECESLLRLDEALKRLAENEKISWDEARKMSRSGVDTSSGDG
jgi:Tfp pilus assembly pilus retraction ATPase PilT/CRP-like cAMP-binding protein